MKLLHRRKSCYQLTNAPCPAASPSIFLDFVAFLAVFLTGWTPKTWTSLSCYLCLPLVAGQSRQESCSLVVKTYRYYGKSFCIKAVFWKTRPLVSIKRTDFLLCRRGDLRHSGAYFRLLCRFFENQMSWTGVVFLRFGRARLAWPLSIVSATWSAATGTLYLESQDRRSVPLWFAFLSKSNFFRLFAIQRMSPCGKMVQLFFSKDR